MLARTTMPTISGPGWNAFLMGGGVEEIGVTDNSAINRVPPVITTSVFDAVKRANQNLTTFAYSGFPEWFGQYIDYSAIDYWLDVPEYTPDQQVVDAAVRDLKLYQPDVMFIYWCDVDNAGHSYGYDRPRYYDAVELADQQVGQVLAALEEMGILDSTLIVLSADHGGEGFSHGISNDKQLTVPFVVAGPGVRAGAVATGYVRNMDVAPTGLHGFGIPLPAEWIGVPVLEAFESSTPQPTHIKVAAAASHVLVVVIGGLKATAVEGADAPNIEGLLDIGASTRTARSVFQPDTLPAVASHLFGTGPEEHGVNNNQWTEPSRGDITPVIGEELFPSIFDVVKAQNRALVTAASFDWAPLERLLRPENIDSLRIYADRDDEGVTAGMEEDILALQPNLMLMYLENVDYAGLEQGWDSAGYYAAVEVADAHLGRVLAALETAQIANDTIVVLVTDHGNNPAVFGAASALVPWAIAGPGVRNASLESSYVRILDTAPTVVAALGLEPSPLWIGRAVTEAFETA
eukprot:TRINITY_DN2723_c0_g1_i1.p1 TRINITY_DN2723_c0_g1~~TRINITY_DN2723_c0_g1_i1.p1  ORF type:complete len:587 (+),score=132.71 TRINITY_DN2723_c0_g1_i1:206-1762(+)